MKISSRVLAATLLLALVVLPGHAQIDDTEQGHINGVLRDLRVALAAGDIEGAMKFYWNDPRVTIIDPDDGVRLNSALYYKTWLQDRSAVQKTLMWRAHERKVHISGDNAFVTFLVTRQVQMGSTIKQKNERGTYVLKKIDGKWLIVAQHISAFPQMVLFQQTK